MTKTEMIEKYPLSVSMADFVDQSLSFFPASVVEQGIHAQRLAYNAMTEHFASPRPASLHVTEQFLSGVRVRCYQPHEEQCQAAAIQILFAHGGGWYLGGLDSHDSFCAHLAHDCGIKVTAVDYALAPESPYPAGLDDIESVYSMLLEQSAVPVVLMGDSAGGNLLAALALRCRRNGLSPAYAQCLIYPALSVISALPSHLNMSDAPLLDAASLAFCWQQYASASMIKGRAPDTLSEIEKEELSPLQSSSHSSLPPAMLFAAEYDPLIDDAYHYQQALIEANVPAELSVISGLVHGGLHGFKSTEEGQQLYSEIRRYVDSLIRARAT